MELFLKEGYKTEDFSFEFGDSDFISSYTKVKEGVWRFLTKKQLASKVFSKIVEEVGFEKLDDFRVITSTLEDVYLALGGNKDGIR
ncbi:MAG: hypothetical protein KAX49_14770 [Halanaerobiales bacterium]|nr:hypothetical protein [Halanaerobiales bacterium]